MAPIDSPSAPGDHNPTLLRTWDHFARTVKKQELTYYVCKYRFVKDRFSKLTSCVYIIILLILPLL